MNPDKLEVYVTENQMRRQIGRAMRLNVVERILRRALRASGVTKRKLPDRWENGSALEALKRTRDLPPPPAPPAPQRAVSENSKARSSDWKPGDDEEARPVVAGGGPEPVDAEAPGVVVPKKPGGKSLNTKPKQEHCIFIHFLADRKCPLYIKYKITRAACRSERKCKDLPLLTVPFPTEWCDSTAAEYKMLNDDEEMHKHDEVDLVAQNIGTKWIQGYKAPCRDDESTRSLLKRYCGSQESGQARLRRRWQRVREGSQGS